MRLTTTTALLTSLKRIEVIKLTTPVEEKLDIPQQAPVLTTAQLWRIHKQRRSFFTRNFLR